MVMPGGFCDSFQLCISKRNTYSFGKTVVLAGSYIFWARSWTYLKFRSL